ncbi:MAG: NAD(+)/NADH kinase [Thermodesulfobacteriota bacterium]
MKKIGLVVKTDPKAQEKANRLESWLRSKKTRIIRRTPDFSYRVPSTKRRKYVPEDVFCVIVLGGDGTFLSAVNWIGEQNIPILGVKFGDVGFLAETAEENLFHAAEMILKENFTLTTRMRLQVDIKRNHRSLVHETVLNDVVVNKGALARLAHIKTFIDDAYLTTYSADGLIISSPTGSTAYSLAAGGPIIHPDVPAIILTPICPFTLTNRPLIIPDSSKIEIQLGKKGSDIMLTFDGQAGIKIKEQDRVTVRKSDHPLSLITLPGHQYYDVLKTKLRWSGGRI